MAFGNFHPGVTLREELEARDMTAASLALKLRVPPQRLHEIIRGNRAITPETALRLGVYFGNEPEFWMNLQTQYDLAELRRTKGAQIAAEVETAA
jgi:addiction module HigA family antidote